ncbi:DNA-binding transcriptional regulator [Parelusimicrobium proximum]|uniref:MerR family transcriptional regulator n=1 Tax=Parelusimicrobium proximum TaxID=3228953 RepID=UPI003D168156
MQYTIAQVAQLYGMTAHTLRYYDKEGLLPFVDRTDSGIRSFKETDFEWLDIITCLKQTGMPVKQIREFIELCQKGESTVGKRLELFKTQKKNIESQIALLKTHLDKVNFKIWYYTTAAEHGLDYVMKHKKYLKELKKCCAEDRIAKTKGAQRRKSCTL